MSGNYSDILSKRFREILNKKGWTYAEFLKNKGLTDYKNSIDNIYYGRSEDPRISTLMIISEALGVSVNSLMGKSHHSKEEIELLDYFQRCGEHGRGIILVVAKFEAISTRVSNEDSDIRSIPCVYPQDLVNQGFLYDTCETKYIETKNKNACVAISVPNNDLIPMICENDVILLENRFPKSGEFGVFYIEDRAYFRQYIKTEEGHLLKWPHHRNEAKLYKRLDNIEYMGTYVDVIRA